VKGNGERGNIGAWLTAIIGTSLSLLLVLVTLFPKTFQLLTVRPNAENYSRQRAQTVIKE
ncbi:MAG: hypothetical protein LC776_19190, partial [Acidobacteria bacterium]|nr:hypothetical protein [Acidobacteriota bacterium]